MSRYAISVSFVVGWDPPLGTFFAQEFDPYEDLIWSVGYTPRELPSIAELRQACISRGVIIPPHIDVKLREDERAAWTPGPLQQMFGFTGKEDAT